MSPLRIIGCTFTRGVFGRCLPVRVYLSFRSICLSFFLGFGGILRLLDSVLIVCSVELLSIQEIMGDRNNECFQFQNTASAIMKKDRVDRAVLSTESRLLTEMKRIRRGQMG